MRHAIYFTPPENGRLTQRASIWLGRNAFSGANIRQPGLETIAADEFAALTADPRRYGFHATLKAPFTLAGGCGEDELLRSFEDFAANAAPFQLPAVALGKLGPFFALVPGEHSGALQGLAEACVRHFEPFRAPLSPSDVAKRRPETLTDVQRDYLDAWGYPYVFDEFRFHMTLTGRVPEERSDVMQAALKDYFADIIGRPVEIDHIALFVEAETGAPFTVRKIARLGASPQRKNV